MRLHNQGPLEGEKPREPQCNYLFAVEIRNKQNPAGDLHRPKDLAKGRFVFDEFRDVIGHLRTLLDEARFRRKRLLAPVRLVGMSTRNRKSLNTGIALVIVGNNLVVSWPVVTAE
ncbi:hypothetical protein PWR05_33485 [Paraburkholderia sp. A2RI-6]|uniref:hypothetical protein n=1 Tax=unclassified Paraburkholderia TaxID=2615204 RepID=UPI003B7E06F9